MHLTLPQAFERAVEQIAHDSHFSGVEIVQHAARRGRRTTSLTLTIDREGGVDLASCERIAATINKQLEAYDEPYTLASLQNGRRASRRAWPAPMRKC